jgi:hypothetical protein
MIVQLLVESTFRFALFIAMGSQVRVRRYYVEVR